MPDPVAELFSRAETFVAPDPEFSEALFQRLEADLGASTGQSRPARRIGGVRAGYWAAAAAAVVVMLVGSLLVAGGEQHPQRLRIEEDVASEPTPGVGLPRVSATLQPAPGPRSAAGERAPGQAPAEQRGAAPQAGAQDTAAPAAPRPVTRRPTVLARAAWSDVQGDANYAGSTTGAGPVSVEAGDITGAALRTVEGGRFTATLETYAEPDEKINYVVAGVMEHCVAYFLLSLHEPPSGNVWCDRADGSGERDRLTEFGAVEFTVSGKTLSATYRRHDVPQQPSGRLLDGLFAYTCVRDNPGNAGCDRGFLDRASASASTEFQA